MAQKELEPGKSGEIAVVRQILIDGRWRQVKEVPKGASTRWRARAWVRLANGSYVEPNKFGKTKEEAKRRLEAEIGIRLATSTGDLGPQTTVQQLADRYLVHTRSEVANGKLAASSLSVYTRVLRTAILPLCQDLKVRELKWARIDAMLRLIDETRGPGICSTAKSVLSNMVQIALKAELLSADPTAKTYSPRRADRTTRAFSDAQWRLLREAMADPTTSLGPDLRMLLEVTSGTGMRIGEALALRWEDVDLTEGWVRVTGTMKRDEETGQPWRQPHPKTNSSWRQLWISPRLSRALSLHLAEWGRFEDDLVIHSPAGRPWTPDNGQRAIREWLRGFEGHDWSGLSSHTFRKTFGTRMLRQPGVTILDVADQLGHSDVSMTMRYYLGREKVGSRAAATVD